MTVEEYLKKDSSYLIIPHNNNIRSLAFWKAAENNKHKTAFAGKTGNCREAYEEGVKIGWKKGIELSEMPHNAEVSEVEYDNFMSLLLAFGYSFYYMINPPYQHYSQDQSHIHPGLNLMRNQNAIANNLVVSEEVKQKVYQLLKENSKLNFSI